MERKIFLENLPTKLGFGMTTGQQVIDWKSSIGYKVPFEYDEIKGEIVILDYTSKKQKLTVNYDNEIFKINTNNLVLCQLGRILGIITKEFKFEIGQVFKDEKRNIVITDKAYKTRERKCKGKIRYETEKTYKYKCNKCGFECGEHYRNGESNKEHWVTENEILLGTGCSCCGGRAVVEGINDIPTTDPWMIKFFQGGYDEAKKYIRNSHIKINPVCPDCNRIKNKEIPISSIYGLRSISCTCGDGISYPNKFMFNLLEQLNIEFETEYSPEWIKPRKYDFYFELENNKYIVEMDGGLGHGKKVLDSSKNTSEETKAIDNYKDKMAKEHGIEVVRINCDKSNLDFIKINVLDSRLFKILDLSSLNWKQVEEFALKNRIKEACEIKRNNPDMATTEIGEILNIHKATINKYLKQGALLGWCDYSPKEERIKTVGKMQKKNEKKIEIYKDGVSLGVFNSCKDLIEKSEELFGVKFQSSCISKVCYGKARNHFGFTFKYI